MSLIWPSTEADVVVESPRLHAFVIGVGDYPHLVDGAGPLASDPLGLSQILTPRYTAAAIARWLLAAYSNAECPLGSIELLVSPASTLTLPKVGPAAVESATKARVKTSFNSWLARCMSHKDNIAFFYFCGHGLETTKQLLLLEDFGNPDVPNQWDNCIDFDGMRLGMRRCTADTQLFFVDACREASVSVLTQLKVGGDSLINASYRDSVACSAAYHAATTTRQAYGPDDDLTYFARAVLSCLNGVAAQSKYGQWIVDTATLSSAIAHVMAQLARRYGLPLTSSQNISGIRRIHEAPSPRVIASVGCTSDAANRAAEIVLSKDGLVIQSGVGEPKPMIEEVDAGRWTIDVRFPGGQFAAVPPEEYTFAPPIFEGVRVP